MEHRKLAEKIVESLEDSTCDLDSIEGVMELLNKHYPKEPKITNNKVGKGVYILGNEYDIEGVFDTEEGLHKYIKKRFGFYDGNEEDEQDFKYFLEDPLEWDCTISTGPYYKTKMEKV